MRNRYFDLLRGLAMLRVVAYHVTGWGALTVIFPAMGLMFALGGSLMAASLDKRGAVAVGSRIRRMLPPLWALAIIAIPVLLLSGLPANADLLWWFFPLQDPPQTGWTYRVFGVVWYLREYLWFVLLSPLALVAFRRWPLPTLAVPYLLLLIFHLDLLPRDPVSNDFALYFGAWLLGFAHHDGMLTRLPRRVLFGIAGVLATISVVLFASDPPARFLDLHDARLADGLFQAAFLLPALGLAAGIPDKVGHWLQRRRPLDAVVTFLNRRAITIYLWHETVHFGAVVVALHVGVNWFELSWASRLAIVLAGVALPVLAVGWVEDVAAKRRPQLWPRTKKLRPKRPRAGKRARVARHVSVPAQRAPLEHTIAAKATGEAGRSTAKLAKR